MKLPVFFSLMLFTSSAISAEHCTAENKKALCKKDVVKGMVQKMCNIVTAKGTKGLPEIKKFRYDCCGEFNYIWINDMQPKMIMHPIKPQLDNQDLSTNKDPDGKLLFVEFAKAAKSTPEGSWVEYKWQKLGEPDPSPKVSWVMKCTTADTKEDWVVGSGTWK
jgi:signal transduction histidine kinase